MTRRMDVEACGWAGGQTVGISREANKEEQNNGDKFLVKKKIFFSQRRRSRAKRKRGRQEIFRQKKS